VSVLRRFATALGASLPAWATAQTQSSASFQVQNGVVDSGGGSSTSASFALTACVGSEIAGSQSSASHRIDSGCGATALFVPVPQAGGGPGDTVPVPALGAEALFLMAALLAAVAARALRRR
jgi:hypothetical protein